MAAREYRHQRLLPDGHEFLNPLALLDFARVDVVVGVGRDRVDPV